MRYNQFVKEVNKKNSAQLLGLLASLFCGLTEKERGKG
jgi:hypothetical protein